MIGGGQDTESEQEFIITGTLSVDGAVPSEIAENNLAYAEKSAENESENAKIAESKNARSISGDFESGRGLSELSARTAFPSINESSLYYKVTATSGNRTVQGEVEQSGKFTIKLSSVANETWTVEVEGFSDSSMAANTKILEGTSGSFQINTNSVKNDISITLSPVSSGNGTVSLPISVATDSGIQSAIVKVFEDAGETKLISTLEYDFSTTKNHTISASVTAGSRCFVFTFYSVDLAAAKQNPNQNIAYKVRETVNVFQNLTTNTWQGNSPYLTGTGTSKTFLVTKTLVDTFNRKEFYVQGTSGTYNPPTNASDDNSGTYFDPFATIQKAVGTINAINDGTSPYTIKVDGTIEIPSDTATSAVIIQPTKPLTLTIESLSTAKATIKANSSDMRVFIVGNGANTSITPNVTMKNLIITGGKNETGGGAGIKLEAGSLTLSNVEVKDNKTTDVGGGICVGGNASLTLNDGTEISNNSADSGGGIYIESGTCTINGGASSKISGNTATRDGGGIYVYGGAKLTMNDCTVSNNSAENGGGILMTRISAESSGILNVTNSEISENTASKSGGGIYVSNGDCNITGGAISNNKAAPKGGGVCLAASNSTIKISGTVTMSGNQLTSPQEIGTAIYANAGATAELDGSSGNINITPAQGDALPTIYLAKNASVFAISDAVLKLGGNVQIGNGNGIGIKIEGKADETKTNIKITAELTSTQTINISYDDAQLNNPIIESEETWQLTQEDCEQFRVTSSTRNYKLKLDGSENQGICANTN